MLELQQRLFLGILRISSWLPMTVARRIGCVLSGCFWALKSRNRHVTEVNIAHCYPELSKSEQTQLARASYLSIGEGLGEMGAVWLKPVEQILASIESIEGEALLLEAIDRSQGLIVLIPHIGNWEVMGLHLASVHQTTSLYELSGRKQIDHFIKKVRSRNGATLVPTNQRGIGRLLKNLKQGQVTAVLPDQLPRGRSGGEYAPFFGHSVLTMTLVNNLLQRTGAEAIFGFAQRTKKGFKLVFKPACREIAADNQVGALTALNRGVEQCIADCPEQYAWEYKRFRDRPKTKNSIYE
jgi:KDO2-lipid IV(A) lauroyltransferase